MFLKPKLVINVNQKTRNKIKNTLIDAELKNKHELKKRLTNELKEKESIKFNKLSFLWKIIVNCNVQNIERKILKMVWNTYQEDRETKNKNSIYQTYCCFWPPNQICYAQLFIIYIRRKKLHYLMDLRILYHTD